MAFEEENYNLDNLEIKRATIVDWYNLHRLHRRKHSVRIFTDQKVLSGKLGYNMCVCLDCQEIYCIDTFQVEDNNEN